MKKFTTFVVGLLAASISFGAVLTNEKYVTNTVNNTIVRELQTFSTQIVERVITDTSITNAGAVAVSKEYTDTKVAEAATALDGAVDTIMVRIAASEATADAATSNLNVKVDGAVSTLTTKIETDVGNLNTTLTAKIAEDIGTASSTLSTKIDTDVAGAKTIAHDELTNFVAQLNAKIGACTAEDPATAKSYVDALVAAVPKFKIVVVNSVPAIGDAVDATVYLVRNESTSGAQLYSEWIRVNTGTAAEPEYTMEKLGEAAVDLTGYAKESYVDDKIDTVNGTISTLSGTVTANKTTADDGIATNKADIAALAASVAADKVALEGTLEATKTEITTALGVVSNAVEAADAKGAQGIADAAGALAFAQGVSNDVVTLSGTVAGNKTAAENADTALAGQITAVSNLVVSADSTMKAYVDGQDTAVGTAANSYTDTKVAAGVAAVTNDLVTGGLTVSLAAHADEATTAAIAGSVGGGIGTNRGYQSIFDQIDAATETNALQDAAIEAAKGYADGVAVTAESNAKGYADGKVATVADGVASNKADIVSLAAKVAEDKAGLEADLVATNALIFAGISAVDTKADTLYVAATNDTATKVAAAVTAVTTDAASDATSKANAAEAAAKNYADGKASTAETNAKTYADGKVEAGVLVATNFTKTAIADLATKGSVTSVSNIAESAKSAATTADSKAVAAQGTADVAEAAAATADAKAVAAQAAATSATNRLDGFTGNVKTYVDNGLVAATNNAHADAVALNNTTMTAVGGVQTAVDTINNTTIPQAKIEAKTNAVNECRYQVKNIPGTVETIYGDTYVVYDLVDRMHYDLEPSSTKIAFRFPAATNSERHDRACIVCLKTPAGTAPSITLLLADGDTTTKVFKGDSVYIPLSSFEANKNYLIYFNELGINKWWYQDCELTQELGN